MGYGLVDIGNADPPLGKKLINFYINFRNKNLGRYKCGK